jgi:hypothetical protein
MKDPTVLATEMVESNGSNKCTTIATLGAQHDIVARAFQFGPSVCWWLMRVLRKLHSEEVLRVTSTTLFHVCCVKGCWLEISLQNSNNLVTQTQNVHEMHGLYPHAVGT